MLEQICLTDYSLEQADCAQQLNGKLLRHAYLFLDLERGVGFAGESLRCLLAILHGACRPRCAAVSAALGVTICGAGQSADCAPVMARKCSMTVLFLKSFSMESATQTCISNLGS